MTRFEKVPTRGTLMPFEITNGRLAKHEHAAGYETLPELREQKGLEEVEVDDYVPGADRKRIAIEVGENRRNSHVSGASRGRGKRESPG